LHGYVDGGQGLGYAGCVWGGEFSQFEGFRAGEFARDVVEGEEDALGLVGWG
jgi:hypothetical protein